MLVLGAEQCRLRADYVAKLRAIPAATPPKLEDYLTEDVMKIIASREFTEDDIKSSRIDGCMLSCLKGVVIKVNPKLDRLWGGRDITLFKAQQV